MRKLEKKKKKRIFLLKAGWGVVFRTGLGHGGEGQKRGHLKSTAA